MRISGTVTTIAVGVVTTCAIAASTAWWFGQSKPAGAQSPEIRTEDESPDLNDPPFADPELNPGLRPLAAREHVSLYDSDRANWPFHELEENDRRDLERAEQWAEIDHGVGVHEGYRGLTREGVNRARSEAAARVAGLVGTENLGVH